MKKYLLFSFTLFASFVIFGQEVVSSAGETNVAQGYEVSWTIGEPVIETVSSGTNILTQGFHQSKLRVTAVNDIRPNNLEVNVYPNPTQEFIIILLNEVTENTGFELYNMSGEILKEKKIYSLETSVSLKNYTSGSYLLKLISNKNQPLQTFKIVKE